MLRLIILYIVCLLLVFAETNFSAIAQNNAYSLDGLVNKLSTHNGPVLSGVSDVLNELKGKDSSNGIHVLSDLESRGSTKDGYFKSRFFLTKAFWLWNVKQPP